MLITTITYGNPGIKCEVMETTDIEELNISKEETEEKERLYKAYVESVKRSYQNRPIPKWYPVSSGTFLSDGCIALPPPELCPPGPKEEHIVVFDAYLTYMLKLQEKRVKRVFSKLNKPIPKGYPGGPSPF